MCSGAIVHSRIKRLVIATEDIKYGACGTVLQVCGNPLLNHNPQIIFGVKREESRELLQKFFANKRMNKKQA
jgi:tRNA(adenine34) deaminase